LAIVVGGVVALLVVFALGRASAGSSSPSAPSPRSAIPGVGPAHTVRGVPVGYTHTRAGALAAALNYTGVIAQPGVLLDSARLRRALSAMATPELAAKLMAEYGPLARQIANTSLVRSLRSGTPTVDVGVPVAYRILRSTPDRVTVQLWTVGVVGDEQAAAPQANWARLTLTLGWVAGDWKYVAVAPRQSGPTPRLGRAGSPTAPSTFIAQLHGFRGFRYAP
jgi:hypothetical protein